MRSCSSDLHAVSSFPFTLAPCIVSTARSIPKTVTCDRSPSLFQRHVGQYSVRLRCSHLFSNTAEAAWAFSVPHSYSGLNFHLRTLLFWEAFFRCLNPRWPCPPLNSPVSFSGLPSEKCVVTTHRIQYSWKTCSAKLLLLFPETWGDGVYAERSYY